jgi:hypothetical protein
MKSARTGNRPGQMELRGPADSFGDSWSVTSLGAPTEKDLEVAHHLEDSAIEESARRLASALMVASALRVAGRYERGAELQLAMKALKDAQIVEHTARAANEVRRLSNRNAS